MVRIKLTEQGVMIEGSDCLSAQELRKLIAELNTARERLIENQARNAEEGYKDIWESS